MRRRIRYRTGSGQRRRLRVHARRGRVCLVFEDGSWCELHGLEVGRVRAALKEKAILSANEPDLDELA
jgi:hypothetical protein